MRLDGCNSVKADMQVGYLHGGNRGSYLLNNLKVNKMADIQRAIDAAEKEIERLQQDLEAFEAVGSQSDVIFHLQTIGVLRMSIEALNQAQVEEKEFKPTFPTMLRKMWSGTEVQQWIDSLPTLYVKQASCCGNPVIGAEFMGAKELVCCGQYEDSGV